MKIILSLIVFIATIALIVSAGGESYYAIRTDVRKCAYPMCGGYFVREIGSNKAEVYVKSLNQTIKGGATVTESQYKNAPPFSVVIKGEINKDEIVVSKIFRLLSKPTKPYNFDDEMNRFFTVVPEGDGNSTTIEVKKLNSNKSEKAKSIENSYGQDVSLVPMDWLSYKVSSGESVFTVNGGKMTSNKTITIDYMFISLPDPKFCPKELMVIRCANETIPTYTSTATRCLSFAGCIHRGICPLVVPGCSEGYTRNSYASKPNGCPHYSCIPSFLS
ncbi:hypothetical protein RB653_010199 [Dictyostelium firmibasis]|uniref:DUF6748 domain-containing protein n=1 Tax=Dictyostelium firmibasis TaxID=79012 RepID=A0AAN7TLF8_9MYCE